jgi:hypothetical protein
MAMGHSLPLPRHLPNHCISMPSFFLSFVAPSSYLFHYKQIQISHTLLLHIAITKVTLPFSTFDVDSLELVTSLLSLWCMIHIHPISHRRWMYFKVKQSKKYILLWRWMSMVLDLSCSSGREWKWKTRSFFKDDSDMMISTRLYYSRIRMCWYDWSMRRSCVRNSGRNANDSQYTHIELHKRSSIRQMYALLHSDGESILTRWPTQEKCQIHWVEKSIHFEYRYDSN